MVGEKAQRKEEEEEEEEEEFSQLKLLTRRSTRAPESLCITDLITRLRRGRFPDLQKVYTNRGRWSCPEGRLTVHEEVGCVLVFISKDGYISI
jgi:hypothetical protein